MTRRWLWLPPLVLGLIAYLPTFRGELVWDDEVIAEYQIQHIRSLRDVVVPPPGITRWSYGYYRPIVIGSYVADARLFGVGAATGPRALNLAMHLGVTLLVWVLLRRVVGAGAAPLPQEQELAAAAGAALFALHPIHAESVNWIAGRSDLLATLFLLAALLAALAWRDRGGSPALVAMPVFFLVALLAKESAITGLALLPVLLVLAPGPVSPGPWRRRLLVPAVLFLAAAAFYLWARAQVGTVEAGAATLPLPDQLANAVRAAGYYLRMLVFPWPQTAMVTWALAPALPAAAAITGLAAAASLAAAWRWWRAGEAAWLMAAAWLWATLSLALWIAMASLNNTPLAERYLYLPSVAVAIVAAALLSRAAAGRRRAVVLAVTTVVLAAAGAATFARSLAWQNDLSLWRDATRLQAVSGLAWLNLGVNEMDAGRDDAALAALARVGEDPAILPHWLSRAENARGTIALRRGEADEAERLFRAATRAMPENHEPYAGLGNLQRRRAEEAAARGDPAARNAAAEAAIAAYVAATTRNALYHAARLLLADLLVQYGDWLAAEGEHESARRRYLAARGQLDDIVARLPPSRLGFAMDKLASSTGIDAAALRARIDAALKKPAGAA